MDGLFEIFFEFFAELFGQLFLLLLSKGFEKVEISSNRTKRLIKFIITFIFLFIATTVIIMSINKNLGNVLFILSSSFILFLIVEHLISFLNNNIFRNRIIKRIIYFIKEIVSYGYFITLLCLLEWLDKSEKKFVIIFSIIGITLLILRDCYRSHSKEKGINNDFNNNELINDNNLNDGHLLYNTNPNDKYFKLLYNLVYFILGTILYFVTVIIVKNVDILDASIWSMVLVFLIIFGTILFLFIILILFIYVGESKLSKYDDKYKLVYEKELAKMTIYFSKKDIKSFKIKKYLFANRYKITIKLHNFSTNPDTKNNSNNKKTFCSIILAAFCKEEDMLKLKVLEC